MSDKPAVTFDWRNGESVSIAVVRAIAQYEGRDPSEIEPLYRAIDTDSLNDLFLTDVSPDGNPGPVVAFGFKGYWVRVSWTGEGELFHGEWPRTGVNEEVA